MRALPFLLVAVLAPGAAGAAEPSALVDRRVDVAPPAGFADAPGAGSQPASDAAAPVRRLWVRPQTGELLSARVSRRRILPGLPDLSRLDRELPRWLGVAAGAAGAKALSSRLRSVGGVSVYEVWFNADLGGARAGAALIAPVEDGALELILLGRPGSAREDLRALWEETVARIHVRQRRSAAPATVYRDDARGLTLRAPQGFQDLTDAAATPAGAAERKVAWVRFGLLDQEALSVSQLTGAAAQAAREQTRAAEGKAPVTVAQVRAMPVPPAGQGGALPFALGGETTLLMYQHLPGGMLSLSTFLPAGPDRVLVLAYVAAKDDFAEHLPAFAALCAQVAPPRAPRWPFAVAGGVAVLLAVLIVRRKLRPAARAAA